MSRDQVCVVHVTNIRFYVRINKACASQPLGFADYVATIGDERLVIDMLVGDLQRVVEYARLGFAVEQSVPEVVQDAYRRLLHDGFTRRLLTV